MADGYRSRDSGLNESRPGRLLQARRLLFIALSASAMVAAATISAYAATAGPGSTHIPSAAAPSSPAGPAAYSGHHDADQPSLVAGHD